MSKSKGQPVYREFENAIKRLTKQRNWSALEIVFMAYGYALESRY